MKSDLLMVQSEPLASLSLNSHLWIPYCEEKRLIFYKCLETGEQDIRNAIELD